MGRDVRPFLHHFPPNCPVSIHAPAWGATCAELCSEEGRVVSIHAPAWGATYISTPRRQSTARFNPRARVGRDMTRFGSPLTPSSFNPRARVGRDQRIARRRARALGFNPRARVGRDSVLLAGRVCNHTFQSTRPRGARHDIAWLFKIRFSVSIHAPAWGATLCYVSARAW